MSRSVIRLAGILLATFGLFGCSDSNPSSTLNLGGMWLGTVSHPDENAPTVRWTASQTGSTVTGPVTVSQVNAPEFSGLIAGQVAGSQLSLTVSFSAGAFTGFGSSCCSMTATGANNVTATAISMSISETWSAACVPDVVPAATRTGQLSLTKQ